MLPIETKPTPPRRVARVLHKSKTTYEQRLAALQAHEAEKRAILAKPVEDRLMEKRKENNFAAQNRPTDTNPYYQYFYSEDGDEKVKAHVLQELGATHFDHERQGGQCLTAKIDSSNWRRRAAEENRKDILGLRPECASLYVKYEKLHEVMKREDREFADSRKKFLDKKY
jgi:hypothetical protein